MHKASKSHHATFAIRLIVFVAFLTLAHGARASSISCTPNSAPSPPSDSEQSMTIAVQSIVVDGNKVDSATSEHVELFRAGSSGPEATVTVGTKLIKGDRICTKDNDQVVLELSFAGNEKPDLVFLDPNSEVEIGSLCANQGRVLAWLTTLVGVCHRYGTLGRKGTEFEVETTPEGELHIVVYEGEVTFQPRNVQANNYDRSNKTEVGGARLFPEETKIPVRTQVTITPVGVERSRAIPSPELGERVDRWSRQIVKTCDYKAPMQKVFMQDVDPATREQAFIQARRDALLNNSEKGYLDMAQALNDWDNGEAAQQSLNEVNDAGLRSSAEFMNNEAEAYRLQGNYMAASAKLNQTLAKYPDDAAANALKGQILLQKVNQSGSPSLKANEEAKKYFSRALREGDGKRLVNAKVVEAQLDQTIKTQAIETLRREPWVSSGQRIFTTDTSNWVSYAGTTSLNVAGTQVSGKSVLSIYGDQFKLSIEGKVFTGRIVGNQHAEGFSLAMDFDDVDVKDPNSENVVISVTGSKIRNGITLHSASNETESFMFKSTTRKNQ